MSDELLTPEQMGVCDRLTIAQGTPGPQLMERAGAAVADMARVMVPDGEHVIVLAGPGNNGGDGYVAARRLHEMGYTVTVYALGDTQALHGDARWAFDGWPGTTKPATQALARSFEADLLIDALFGAGLTRGLDGLAADLVAQVNRSDLPVLAVDLPSGLNGGDGIALGPVIDATHTITFHRLKPGHVLHPGRGLCGPVRCVDIGIDPSAIETAGFAARLTGPGLATRFLQRSQYATMSAHKYAHGHVLVRGGPPERAGAGFLAAVAALRCGAGLVTLATPQATMAASVGRAPALMRATCEDAADLARLLDDPRLSVCVLGPGLPPDENTRQLVYAALASQAALVLDAGALTAFSGMAEALFAAIKARSAPVVLTPHDGEFRRLFGQDDGVISKLERACQAAALSGASLVLKGTDTVVAHPCGRPATLFVNANAPPWLATAGSGDVLAGAIAGLLARSGPTPLDAEALSETIALAIWLHGDAALRCGPALIASDLDAGLRLALQAAFPATFTALEHVS